MMHDEETVTFSDREWEAMMADPVYFGYACNNGHACREDDPFVIANGCPTCFGLGEMSMDCETDEDWEALHRYAKTLEVFPVLECPDCGWHHVGTGALERCHERILRRSQEGFPPANR